MEQFHTYHNKSTPCRNRAELFMLGYIKELLKSPVDLSIEHIYKQCTEKANEIGKNKGKVTFTELHTSFCVAGAPTWCVRGFRMFGTGRNTATLAVSENLIKDAANNFEVVKCSLNGNI